MEPLNKQQQKEQDLKELCEQQNINFDDLIKLLNAIKEKDFSKRSNDLEEIINNILEK